MIFNNILYYHRRKAIMVAILLVVIPGMLFGATRREISSALESARRDLRINVATEERIASDLERLRESADIPADVIDDYEEYLRRVQAMVSENRDVVAKLEALSAGYNTRAVTGSTTHQDHTEAMVDPVIPEEQVVDEVAALDRQLDSSLNDFDEMLLTELDLIRAESSEKMQDLSEQAAAAAERLREKGIDLDSATEGEGQESDQAETAEADREKQEGPQSGKESGSKEGGDDTEMADRDHSMEGVEGSSNHPRNRHDPKNDDIVARQLREAAEKETDPELRAKLWKEYDQYKKNASK